VETTRASTTTTLTAGRGPSTATRSGAATRAKPNRYAAGRRIFAAFYGERYERAVLRVLTATALIALVAAVA
jgi:hypothetical protein